MNLAASCARSLAKTGLEAGLTKAAKAGAVPLAEHVATTRRAFLIGGGATLVVAKAGGLVPTPAGVVRGQVDSYVVTRVAAVQAEKAAATGAWGDRLLSYGLDLYRKLKA